MNKVRLFLEKYQMSSSDIDIKDTLIRFKKEISKGLEQDAPVSICSIPMIATYIKPSVVIKEKETVIVIDAGGTNLRIGLAKYCEGCWNIYDVTEFKMPGIDREYSYQEFFDYIAERMIPYLDKAINIGFCFSYRVKMNASLDGKLIAWAKEIKAKEVVGKDIGASLLEAIKKYSNVKRDVVVLNDTTAVLLGGISLDTNKEFKKYIGSIYGTGFNCCYMEQIKNITKLNSNSDEVMIINTETGNFNGFHHGVFDVELTKESQLEKEALTEKMSSGRYLASLIYKATVKAKEDGLIEELDLTKSNDFDLPKTSMYLAGIIDHFAKCFKKDKDKDTFKEICKELIDRASKVVATTISAFAIQSNVEKIGIIIEGSTFYKLPTFKESFNQYLKNILDEYNIKYKLFDGRDRILIGAAMASMCK